MRRLAQNFLLLGVSLVLAIGFLEVGARILLPPPPVFQSPQVRHVGDPVLGYALVPDQDAYTHDRPARVNRAGLRRSSEISPEKPRGERRVLVLGDSFTFGNGVLDDETYPAVLEALLRDAGIPAEVLNAGVQGYSVHQEAAWLAERGFALDPDVVIVGFYANDVTIPEDPAEVATRFDSEGQLRQSGLRGLFSDEVVYALKRLTLASLLAHAGRELRYRIAPPADDYWTKSLVRGQETPDSLRAWTAVEDSLRAMRDGCAERGIPMLVLVQPLPWQIAPDTPTENYQGRLDAILERLGLRNVDVLDAYRAATARGDEIFIPYDGHPTALGQRLTAETLLGPVVEALDVRRGEAPPRAQTSERRDRNSDS